MVRWIGAGVDFSAACWSRIAAPCAKFQMPGWNFDLALGTRRLTRLVGQHAARDLLIDTKRFSAEHALQIGLVREIVPQDSWEDVIQQSLQCARSLPIYALGQLFNLTNVDTRSEDTSAIVRTAGRPGFKNRILAYRESIFAQRKTTRSLQAKN